MYPSLTSVKSTLPNSGISYTGSATSSVKNLLTDTSLPDRDTE